MEKKFPNGMWPVMLTPLQQNGDVDYPALGRAYKLVHKGRILWIICGVPVK